MRALADSSAYRLQLHQIARRLLLSRKKIIGLWPAGPLVPVPPLALGLAAALHERGGGQIAVVDGNPRLPTASIAEDGADVASDLFLGRRVFDGVMLIAPRPLGLPGAGVVQLELVLLASRELFARLIVDLTGYDRLGDHLAAIDLADAVVLVARAGVTRENELLTMKSQLPEAKSLGAILVG